MYTSDMFLNDVDKLLDKIRKEGSYKIITPSNYDTTGLSQVYKDCREIKIPIKEIEEKHKKELENRIKHVKFDNPWTVVWWDDGSITRTKCSSKDRFSQTNGLMAAICKHYFEDTNVFCKVLEKWCDDDPHYDKMGIKDPNLMEFTKGFYEGYNYGYRDGNDPEGQYNNNAHMARLCYH